MAESPNKNTINLLTERFRRPGRLELGAQNLRKVSIAVLGIYILVLFLMFGGFLFLSQQEGEKRAKNETLVSDVSRLKNREGLLLTLKNRASVAQKFFTENSSERSQKVGQVVSLLGDDAQVTEVDSQKEKLVLTAVANDSNSLRLILPTLKSLDVNTAVLTTLSLNRKTGGYSFSLEIK